MLARHIPKRLAPQRGLSLGVRRMLEGGISESSSEHFHASGKGMDATITGSTMEDFLAARNESDRVAKLKGTYFKNFQKFISKFSVEYFEIKIRFRWLV